MGMSFSTKETSTPITELITVKIVRYASCEKYFRAGLCLELTWHFGQMGLHSLLCFIQGN